jgi:hypothetical protein
LRIKKLDIKQVSGITKTYAVLEHPKIEYYISPRYFGLIQDFGERNFGFVQLFAIKSKTDPFILKAGNKTNTSYFVIAPSSDVPVQVEKKRKKKCTNDTIH